MLTNRIAELNQRCRQGLDLEAKLVITNTCFAMLAKDQLDRLILSTQVQKALRDWKPAANDESDNEQDFGILYVRDQKLFFKIDYYDRTLEWGSEDPANPEVTIRVMTVMMPEDY